jgi:hypothetical protein
MNIKDLKYLKKLFNIEKSTLKINDVYSVFIDSNRHEILSTQFSYFNSMEEEVQDILLKNMKKILSGKIDEKIFVEKFSDEMLDDADGSSKVLTSILKDNKNAFIEHCDVMTNKLLKSYMYEHSTVIYFVRATLIRKSDSCDFVICTINKAEVPKQQFVYNYDEKNFEYKSHTEPVIKMTSPIEGFMFPVLENEVVDREKILYYSSKSNKINTNFVFNVLNCTINLTAKQEKTYFHDILNTAIGGKIKPVQLYNIYDGILKRFEQEEDEEYRTLTPSTLKTVLDENDIKTVVDLNEAYTKVLGNTTYQFKVNNIIPDAGKKSINIGNDNAEIKIRPDYLENVHQVQTDDGDMYLLIRLDENLSANGFNIDMESIEELLK